MAKKSNSSGGGGKSGGGGGNKPAEKPAPKQAAAKPAAKKDKTKSAPPAPQQRSLADEMAAISGYAQANAQAQANTTVDTAGRLSDQAIENTGDIANKLQDSSYTAAANQNIRDAGTSSAQLGQSYNQVGQTADRVAAYNDPAQARLNQMAMGQLYRPDQISSQNVAADQVTGSRVASVGNMQAAQAGPVQNIRASAAERGLMNEARGNGLLGQLEGQASNDLALGRSLSAEQNRDATQSARAGYAARGLGLGQSAMAAELLNRDRFATARENERRTFAGNVLGQGAGIRQAANQAYMGRMEGNVGRQQQLNQFNTGLTQQGYLTDNSNAQQAAMADAGYAQQAALSNQDANLRAAQYNSGQNLAAQQANQSANYNANYANQNFLQGVASQNFNQFSGQQSMLGSLYGQQAGIAQNQYANNLGLAQANVALDPYQRALGSNIPIASQGNAANMIGQSFTGTMGYGSDLYNTNLNMGASLYNTYNTNQAAIKAAQITGGATSNAGWMSMLGSGMQAGGAIGGAAITKSDRRLKKDIKPIGKGGAGGILGLTTYEFRYKDGDDRKHIGFMAQDVRKVLPEAVEEFDYKGQKRLAIKPKVIGAAIAEILAEGQSVLFDKGYTVGSGHK